jgi:hypothetical protein
MGVAPRRLATGFPGTREFEEGLGTSRLLGRPSFLETANRREASFPKSDFPGFTENCFVTLYGSARKLRCVARQDEAAVQAVGVTPRTKREHDIHQHQQRQNDIPSSALPQFASSHLALGQEVPTGFQPISAPSFAQCPAGPKPMFGLSNFAARRNTPGEPIGSFSWLSW